MTNTNNNTNTKNFDKIITEFAVYDKVAEMFMQPFRAPNKFKAIQGFKDAANTKNTPINNHPEDYEIYEIGTFNEKTGERTNNKVLLAKASDLIENKNLTKEDIIQNG